MIGSIFKVLGLTLLTFNPLNRITSTGHFDYIDFGTLNDELVQDVEVTNLITTRIDDLSFVDNQNQDSFYVGGIASITNNISASQMFLIEETYSKDSFKTNVNTALDYYLQDYLDNYHSMFVSTYEYEQTTVGNVSHTYVTFNSYVHAGSTLFDIYSLSKRSTLNSIFIKVVSNSDNLFDLTAYAGIGLSYDLLGSYNDTFNVLLRYDFPVGSSCYLVPPIKLSWDSNNTLSPHITIYYSNFPSDAGYDLGYTNGYTAGETAGYSQGFYNGSTEGYNSGYQQGYSDGLSIGSNANFVNLFGLIADTPVMMLKSLFNWELFGFNVFTALLSLLTGLVVIYVIKKVIH